MVLFQDVFSFMENNMIDHAEFSLLRSVLKVFYLFKVNYQFENDEVTVVWIQCNKCINKIYFLMI